MRPIKFRAWDGQRNRMIYLGFNWTNDAECIPVNGNWDDIVHPDDLDFMEFTGLTDKNGKEIYEGDICEILNEKGLFNRFVVKFGIVTRKMDTGWIVDIPSFYFDLIGRDFQAFPIVTNYKGTHDLTMMEVIGNIYENFELLEAPCK